MNTVTRTIKNTEQMETLGAELAALVPAGCIIFLSGELGAGKTTLVRGFLRALGYTGTVKSPTYTLVEPYYLNNHTVAHFDLYRLTHAEELEFIGARDYFSPTHICLIEWPERGLSGLPTPDIACTIEWQDTETRYVQLTGQTSTGKRVLQLLHSK